MHAEPINDQLVKENVPGDDRVNTFDEWAAYTRSNAIVSPTVLPPSHRHSKHNSLITPITFLRTVDFPSYRNGRARTRVLTRWVLETQHLVSPYLRTDCCHLICFLFWPGVVAPDFKVHRTTNLRVVDASVIPLTFSVAPLATVFAIAEKVLV